MAASVIGAVVAAAVTGPGMVFGFATSFLVSTIARTVISFVVGAVVRGALGGNDKNKSQAAQADPVLTSRDRMVTIRQPISPWQVIYGQARVGGSITFIHTSGNLLYMVITLAGHVCEEIGDIYFNDEVIPVNSGGAATGRHTGYVNVRKSLGDEAGQPFSTLVTDSGGKWTDAHRQTGRAKIFVTLVKNPDLFPTGIPNITAVVKGRKVVDPRAGSPTLEAWSANPTLCVHDYLTNADFGFGADEAQEIDSDTLAAAANACEEDVDLSGSPTVTETRYECNGAFRVDAEPKKVIGLLLAAMAGKAVNVGGLWHVFAGVYEVPTITLDEDDLAGPIKVQSLLSRRENANGVKGLFTDPDSHWQPTSFPALASDSYLAEDGGQRVWKDMDLSPFVTSGTQAQRLSKIELLSVRQGLSVSAQFKLTAWAAMTGRTVALTNTKFGWTAKAFDVITSRFVMAADGVLAVEMTLRETAAAVYDWSTSEEQSVDIAPNTDLPDPFDALDIADLTATSGTADLFRQGDGTIVPRVRLRWTEPANPFIRYYEVQFERLSGSPTEWIDVPDIVAPAAECFVPGVNDGEAVNLRIRAVTTLGNAGEWAYVYGHTVVGKTAAPSDVTGAVAFQNGDVVVFGCNTVDDADLDLIEVRWLDYGDTNYGNGVPVGNILRGQQLPSASIPQGEWTFLFKAKDTSGNYSDNAARADLTVTADGYTLLESQEESPRWLGTLDGFLVSVSNALVPDSSLPANQHTNAELFEQYVPHPVTTSTYTAPEIDKGLDATARIYGDIVSVLGRGVSTGVAAPDHQVDLKLAAGSYDGFESWSVGSATFRYAKSRISSTNANGRIKVTAFQTRIDALTRGEDGTFTTPAGGSVAVSFASPFHSTPGLVVSPQGSGNVSASWDGLSSTGFTGYFKSGGAAAAGTASYKATGA